MLDMIDATNTIESVDTDFPPETTTETDDELGEAITSLWAAHLHAKNAARATRNELRDIRAKLGEQLHEMKKMLACPGRDGKWSAFLRAHEIPRATADRLVLCHTRLLSPDLNRPSEANAEPAGEDVQKLFAAVWPKLRRTLRSRQSLQLFVDLLNTHYERGDETDRQIFVLTPAAPTSCPPPADGDVGEPEVGGVFVGACADEQVI